MVEEDMDVTDMDIITDMVMNGCFTWQTKSGRWATKNLPSSKTKWMTDAVIRTIIHTDIVDVDAIVVAIVVVTADAIVDVNQIANAIAKRKKKIQQSN